MSLTPEQSQAILEGVKSCDSYFYAAGGAILVALAGMWGFSQVSAMLGYQPQGFDEMGGGGGGGVYQDAAFSEVPPSPEYEAEWREVGSSMAHSVENWGIDAMPGTDVVPTGESYYKDLGGVGGEGVEIDAEYV